MTQMSIDFPVCVLPACTTPVQDPTQPCPGCAQAFGDYLQPTATAQPLTSQDVADRDQATREALRQQLVAKAAARIAAPAAPERKAGQICWLCDERRTCTRTPSGWECDSCQGIR